jgi:hypothetical protein
MRNGATTWRDHDRARNVSESRISQASEADLSGPLPMSALGGQKADLDRMSASGGGLNWSAQHSNLLAKMECGHETATSYLLLGGPAIRDLGSLAGRRADEFDRAPI